MIEDISFEYCERNCSNMNKTQWLRQHIHKLTNEKGRIVLGYEDYVYTLERKNSVKLIFRCQNRDCRGKII